ncbi:MAG: hypothetical protein RLZZ519_2768 [Bacteroidota bacterium]|jgi:hypothetical protein
MKKFYTFLGLALLASGLQAQSTFSDDFESYNVGAYVAQVSPNWTTWSGASGGPEDAQVTDAQASSGTKSIYFNATSATGGPQDLVLPFGGQYNTGQFHYEMDMMISTGKGAYFNFQANSTIGQLWALEAHFIQTGSLILSNTSGTYLTTTYPTGTWFNVAFDINLNTNNWELFIDNVSQGSFSNAVNQVASLDIYPVNSTTNGGNGLSTFWVDDVSYTHTPYTLPATNAAVVGIGAIHPATREPGPVNGIVGQSKYFAAKVRNLGQNAITSFDLSYTYNGAGGTANITGVNIPSLASQVVEFATPGTLITGTNNLVVNITSVNGGTDNDPLDDTGTRAVNITAVPAANKIVVGEEGTGTWCQWCPRGAVFMDYMHDAYDGYWAGIAVHNQDPMLNADYDGPFSGFLTGYPGVLVERGTEIDPLDMEQEFLTKITVAPTATLVNGATWDANTRTLDVSVTYTFTGAADQFWRVACVLTEDSVSGTTSLYSQSNAYANNAAGPMGGFESLPASVPAATMNYNHVARALSPNFAGYYGFSGAVSPGAIHTFNFTFVLPSDWDESKIAIVGMLIDDGGEIDNGSLTSIDEAVNNGFVAGTTIVGVEQLEGPDAIATLSPNPTSGNAWLSLNLDADTEVSVTITDVQGRKLADRSYGILNGGQRIELNSSNFAKGLYFVKVTMGDVVKTQRLVVN